MEANYVQAKRQHLAWHETLEIHELVAFQSNGLMRLKQAYRSIHDAQLKNVYRHAIRGLSKNITELLTFYPLAPQAEERSANKQEAIIPFYAGDLLGLAKTSVRNYAIAITETATPALRQILTKQLLRAIDTHARVFRYMHAKSFYPAYHLQKLLQNDVNLANKSLDYKF
ncbi:spore coat protein [Pueribacillus sp. YX66]|uniref:spore coat protein n=1 Tax=Pueribacillus sp. YX66 TaxID=3229242 RepID=UPI00358D61D9